MPAHDSDAPLSALERDLRVLVPAVGGLDRDTLLFRAGQASVRRGWFWPTAAGLMTAAAASLGVAWLVHPTPEPVVRTQVVTVVVHEQPPPAAPPLPAPSEEKRERPVETASNEAERPESLRLRDQMVRWGADVFPCPPLRAAQPSSVLRDAELLGIPAKDMIELERPVFAGPRTGKQWGGSL